MCCGSLEQVKAAAKECLQLADSTVKRGITRVSVMGRQHRLKHSAPPVRERDRSGGVERDEPHHQHI
jgi:hypothetical protein